MLRAYRRSACRGQSPLLRTTGARKSDRPARQRILDHPPRVARVLLGILDPAHHLAQPGPDLLDAGGLRLLARLVEDGVAGLVLEDPFAGELAALDLLEDLLHLRPHRVVDDARSAGVV